MSILCYWNSDLVQTQLGASGNVKNTYSTVSCQPLMTTCADNQTSPGPGLANAVALGGSSDMRQQLVLLLDTPPR